MLNKKKNYTFDWNEFKGSLQIDTIPYSFKLTEAPVKSLLDYYNRPTVYTIEYMTNERIDTGLIKKRIDIDEDNIGIVREYTFIKKGKDTTITVFDYYKVQ
jgi:hypothetical protein